MIIAVVIQSVLVVVLWWGVAYVLIPSWFPGTPMLVQHIVFAGLVLFSFSSGEKV